LLFIEHFSSLVGMRTVPSSHCVVAWPRANPWFRLSVCCGVAKPVFPLAITKFNFIDERSYEY